jgi:NADP-dependent 3-hydroxy acid dehydrogenase YdfG
LFLQTQVLVEASKPAAETCESTSLAGRVAVVTGASSGIGRAIAFALARQGAQLCLIGRNPNELAETVAAVQPITQATDFQMDLTDEQQFAPLLRHLETEAGRLDILIHSAGVIHLDTMAHSSIESLDVQYATNVRAPYLLTQRLLPLLTATAGQVAFINSSVALGAKRMEAGQYSATKCALKAIADSLREEVNSKGIRVLTLYLGRSATPMQEALYLQEGRAYQPELLLQPGDIASVIVHALMLPPTAEVTDITMRPMKRTY